MIRPAIASDAAALAQIYNPYILDTSITFEVEPVDGAEMARRVQAVTAANLPWLVLEQDGEVSGYCYAHPWKERAAYSHTVESTIYIAQDARGRGLGKLLYGELLAQLKMLPLHAVIAVIALPNPASVGLHERMGFEQVAHYREVGRKFERWLNVGAWQLMLGD